MRRSRRSFECAQSTPANPMRLIKSLLTLLALASFAIAQNMTTVHVDGNTAIHTDA